MREIQLRILVTFLGLLTLTVYAVSVKAERIKDLANIAGVRTNHLVGYGLVVGLDGTGDQTSQTPFTTQSLKSMLQQFGVTIPPNVNPQTKNVAAVDRPTSRSAMGHIRRSGSPLPNSKAA